MSVYDQTVREARVWVLETYNHISDALFSPFSQWNEMQKLVMVAGLMTFLAYVAARPPRKKRRYSDDSTDHGFVFLMTMLIGGFAAGFIFHPV